MSTNANNAMNVHDFREPTDFTQTRSRRKTPFRRHMGARLKVK